VKRLLIPLLCLGCQIIHDAPGLRARDKRIRDLEQQIEEEKARRREKVLSFMEWFDS
jgi:hypothetical protein